MADNRQPPAAGIAQSIPLEALYPTIGDAIVLMDRDGIIRSFSPSAATMFGYSEKDVVGENVSILMTSPYREEHDGYLQRYHQTGERHILGSSRVMPARRRDGSTFPCELSVGDTVVDGQQMFLGIIHDLTIRQSAFRRLHSMQSELAHVARISQMGTMASAMAHELNQPLAAVSNYVEAVRASLISEGRTQRDPIVKALTASANEIDRIGIIIRRLRDFIRYGDSVREEASAKALVNEALALALADGDGAGVAVGFFLESKADSIFVDRIQFQQVMVNLLRNALEAMLGRDDRTIEIRSRGDGKLMVEFIVSDSGPGLDPKIAQRLFEPFHSTKAQGLGLGLSISHNIVTAHGGRIWAEPSPLGGTSFHFTVPMASVPGDEPS